MGRKRPSRPGARPLAVKDRGGASGRQLELQRPRSYCIGASLWTRARATFRLDHLVRHEVRNTLVPTAY
ncbi:uncharacterized protein B0H18DRAFT_989789 [Fomitopsis serialis]|uniref:uncharacterized protein n=1 Tax=Fomitopsis serialis TaxID=139415 RepID=UPI0020078904|nr:uncharacterized protein B0H18DRAFT_989789 [Neoantrodia serialis]KAH9931525.1 hypothetical protein B0H18DRAFT_989789 [Neoantrodia serialis]